MIGLVKEKQENVVEKRKKVRKLVNIGVWKHAVNTMIVKKHINFCIYTII